LRISSAFNLANVSNNVELVIGIPGQNLSGFAQQAWGIPRTISETFIVACN